MEQGGYTTDAGGGDQGSYDYGGGGDFNLSMGAGGDEYAPGVDLAPIDWGFDTTSWPTLSEGSDFGGGYLPGLDPSSGFVDLGDGFIYDVNTGGVLDTGLWQGGSGFDDVWRTEYEGWRAFGADEATAAAMADQALEAARAAEGAINISQSATELDKPPELPDLSVYYSLPYVPNYDPWTTPPYTPTFPDLPAPLPPIVTPTFPLVAPPVPQVTQTPTVPGSGAIPKAPGLPPACPTGQYHPFPIGHPEQNKCIPFPPAQGTSSSQQRAPSPVGGSQSKPPPQQQKPPQQQQCPTGYCKHPQTGQCLLIPQGYFRHPTTQVCSPRCTTPGTVYDQARGQCVPVAQAVNPLSGSEAPGTQLPSELTGLFGDLKNIPWWLWIAGLGALLLLGKDDDGRKTTVVHKRAS